MEPAISLYEQKKSQKTYEVVQISDQLSEVVKPIKTMPMCLKCHGRSIARPVQNKISKLYPHDKATGYQVGETRCYFWGTFRIKK